MKKAEDIDEWGYRGRKQNQSHRPRFEPSNSKTRLSDPRQNKQTREIDTGIDVRVKICICKERGRGWQTVNCWKKRDRAISRKKLCRRSIGEREGENRRRFWSCDESVRSVVLYDLWFRKGKGKITVTSLRFLSVLVFGNNTDLPCQVCLVTSVNGKCSFTFLPLHLFQQYYPINTAKKW